MAHIHSVTDSDKRFTIDELMKISNVGEIKALKRGDHAAERYSFTMPRFIEGHDMSLCNIVEVHFDNIRYDSDTRQTTTNASFDYVDDFGVDEEDENIVTWSWLIKSDATQLDGTLNFCVRFACINDESIIEYQKFTEAFEGVPVGESIYNGEQLEKEYSDAVQKWKAELETWKDEIETDISEGIERYEALEIECEERIEKMDMILSNVVFVNEVAI